MHGTLAREYKVLCVPPKETWRIWPRVEAFLRGGQKAGGEYFDKVSTLIDLRTGHLLLWIAYQDQKILAAALTRLIKGDDLVCQLVTIGGSGMRRWVHLRSEIESYARDEGCSRMRLYGRAGWKRVLADYQQTGIILEKRL
jgi:hypothetical protein